MFLIISHTGIGPVRLSQNLLTPYPDWVITLLRVSIGELTVQISKAYAQCLFLLVVIISLLVTKPAAAEMYLCTINDHRSLSGAGLLESFNKNSADGAQFSLNTASGDMLGSGYASTSVWASTTVINNGGKDMSFAALTLGHEVSGTGGQVHTKFIVVAVWADSKSKPFLMSSGLDAFSGLCEELD